MAVRQIKHEAVPGCGSFEVRFPDGRPSQYIYWDDLPSRRLNPATLDRETALEQAKAAARVRRESLTEAMYFIFHGSIIFAVIASNIRWQLTPNGYLASMLGGVAAVLATVAVNGLLAWRQRLTDARARES
jgi:hypothetical protein